jgi:formate/nitrite transporter FocA (FNT family)
MAFVAIGFEHSVANMYFIPAGILLMNGAGFTNVPGVDPNVLGWVNFLWRNLLPVTIGNIIGGVVFVGMSYWGAYPRPVKSDS